MLRQQTTEEKRLWKALSGYSQLAVMVQPTGTVAEIRQVERALRREFWNMTWWRYPLAGFMISSSLFLLLMNFIEVMNGKTDSNLLMIMIKSIACIVAGILILFHISPSRCWKRGIHMLLELSKYASPNESVRALLFIGRLDYISIGLNKENLAPAFYERLAEVLTRLIDFMPSEKEHRFLQHIVLNSKPYPVALRIAALLTLSSQPQKLNSRFRAKLEKLWARERNKSLEAAFREVLNSK